MSVFDRLRTMRYIAPSGSEFVLEFDELVRTLGKKSIASEYPGRDAGSVQDLGRRTRRYPIVCYISGPDYDEEADRFAAALEESGPGVLEHPRWGTLDVHPSLARQHDRIHRLQTRRHDERTQESTPSV